MCMFTLPDKHDSSDNRGQGRWKAAIYNINILVVMNLDTQITHQVS